MKRIDEIIKYKMEQIKMYEDRVKDFDEKNHSKLVGRCKELALMDMQIVRMLEDLKDLRAEKSNRPTHLYAIENTSTGKILFNARGCCYKLRSDAKRKLSELGELNHRIVTYKMVEGETEADE